jgi:hypothetical protein
VQCERGIPWVWRFIFSKDVPIILHSLQHGVLIRGVHCTRLTLKAGTMTSEEVDAKLEEWGALDLCYPEWARYGE